MHSDPIADMLTRIRNANMIRSRQVAIPSSKIKVGIAKILQEEGFVEAYGVTEDKPQPRLVLALKYTGRYDDPVLTGLERVSKPGRRVYAGHKDIPWVRSGLGINIISTSKGLLTGRQARREKAGGEIICNVW